MKVMFINVGPEGSYPTGIGALSAFIKREGHRTVMVDIVASGSRLSVEHYRLIANEIDRFNPSIVGFTLFETGFYWIKQICDFIKERWPSIVTVVGGYYPTLVPEEVICHDSIDIICRGEGEYPLLNLVNALERGMEIRRIRNLWVKQDGLVYKNEVGPLCEDLDELPFWDREMFDYQNHLSFTRRGDRNAKVMAGRGCPYRCTYCSNFYFRELYPNKNKYLRLRSVGHLVEELSYLKRKFEFEYFGFHDDNFVMSARWLGEFSERYNSVIGMPFYCAARPELCTEEILDYLKEAGCFMLLIGIESGDEEYRKKMMNRRLSNEMILDACERIKRRGMRLWTFNMVGMPGETKRHLMKTILLNWRVRPDFAMTSIFYPFKGTELGNLCYKEGLVDMNKKKIVGSYANDTILRHPNISVRKIIIAKYCTIFSAVRSRFFLRQLFERLRNWGLGFGTRRA
jgi:radical SAM superfamily enzyme YgiQ (UPF0313 family)